jgi:hypothetical protein
MNQSTPVHSTLVPDAIVRSGLSVITIDLDDDRAHREVQCFPSAGRYLPKELAS